MIERHYGALLEGANARIAGRVDALEAELEQAAEDEAEAGEVLETDPPRRRSGLRPIVI
jgi:hypothetical protein